MPINQLVSELLTIGGIPDNGLVASAVGNTLSFLPVTNGIAAGTVTLTRKPTGSSAAVSSGAVTFDLPGVYLVTVAVGGITRNLVAVVWPVAALGRPLDATGRVTSLTAFQSAMNDPKFNIATAEAALESVPLTADKYAQIWLGGPVNFAAYVP